MEEVYHGIPKAATTTNVLKNATVKYEEVDGLLFAGCLFTMVFFLYEEGRTCACSIWNGTYPMDLRPWMLEGSQN